MKIIDCFRHDNFFDTFYFVKDKNIVELKHKELDNYGIVQKREFYDNYAHFSIDITPKFDIIFDTFKVFGLRLGIDSYMECFPEWDNKFFPTSIRCEKNGFWGIFISPLGKIISVCSPSNIVSWKNEYNKCCNDVGHRIYTTSIEFVNLYKNPSRHIKSPNKLNKNSNYHYDIYFKLCDSINDAISFIYENANIDIKYPSKFMLELGEKYEYNGKALLASEYGRHIISENNEAECSVFVRRELFYYLDRAYHSANVCQQKIGTHGESYYGFFTMAFYVKITNNDNERKKVLSLFDKFFSDMTVLKNGKIRLKQRALPHRLQNISTLISILVDMYEISNNIKYIDYANDLAEFLMSLQSEDGSYRSHGTHYTCVIYPAKSMLELAIIEKKVGLIDRYNTHFYSAVRAINNLNTLKDNIQTEGQMTFEDGMISCEALQLGFLATLIDDEKLKKSYTDTAEMILEKHICLEQIAIPDCRCIGATLRFWEARYDINFRSNMLNCPHGWTSWKNYASYYLYILTGKSKYLKDLMNTIGACLQMIDENGILNWAFILDPYIVGEKMVKSNKLQGFDFEPYVVSEEYLPMVSDWHRQKPKAMPMQYIINFSKLGLLFDKHGSCDNDVHEHFKCIEECIFGKIFIHLENENQVLYNCYIENNTYYTKDKHVKQAIVFSEKNSNVNIMDKEYTLNKGINIINL